MMTNDEREELIEAERMDVPQMIARASYWRGWCIDNEIDDKELVRLRYLLDAVQLHLYDVRDGAEQAHAPSDDEREALADRLTGDILDAVPDDNDMQHVLELAAAALRRTAVQEPSGETWKCGKCGGTPYEHSLTTSECIWEPVEAHPDPQVEPSDAPTVQLMARKGGKTQALIDSLLGQANERGIRVEVVYPQGGPTDTELLAASNAYMHYKPPYDDLSAFSFAFLDDMRAALRAAYEEGKKR